RWLADEHQPDSAAAILASLRDQPAAETLPYLETAIRDRRHSQANRLTALADFTQGLHAASTGLLVALAQALEDGPLLAEALRRIGKFRELPVSSLLVRKLTSPDAEVRAAAIEAFGERRDAEGREPALRLLQDKDVRVRRAAAAAVGKLAMRQAIESLLK